ncbi:MAG: Transcriptional regulator, TrmB [Parcubacteria bacterium C7867-008]|nr:MAG: Transcriptional regulator, TrmB [Parcubacteria bacterium C7867-008]
MDEKLLESLNLNDSELALYQAILQNGPLAPAGLAKAAQMKRTTAYSVARSLVEKGLLTEDSTRRPRVFMPSTPDEIIGLIEGERQKLVLKEETLKKVAAELSKISAKTAYPVPTVRFIEESKISSFLHQQAEVWDANLLATDERTWWGFQDHTFVEHYNEWISWYWLRWPEGIDLKLLSNRAPIEVQFAKSRGHLKNRNIKFWGEAADFLSTTWIVGDYLIMINTRTKPFYLVEIHDKLMAHDQREVFKNLWPLV